jgi:hypothetical protein
MVDSGEVNVTFTAVVITGEPVNPVIVCGAIVRARDGCRGDGLCPHLVRIGCASALGKEGTEGLKGRC